MIDLNTRLIEIVRPSNADEIVKCIVANALWCVGLTGDAPTRDRFADLISPANEPDATVMAQKLNAANRQVIWKVLGKPFGAGGISTCGMVGEGIHKNMRALAPTLYRPYQWGSSVSRAESYLRTMNAWHSAREQDSLDPRPPIGGYVVIGLTKPKDLPPAQPWDWGGIEHAFTPIAWEGDNNDILVSVDGGQVAESGLQAVRIVRRRYVLRRGHPWVVRVDQDPATAQGRRVYGWGTAELMSFRRDWLTCVVPEGWDKENFDATL